MHNIEENLLISNTDYSKLETIKSIEMFKNKILQILDEQNNNIKSKILLHGIIKNFEELISSNAEYNYIYNTLLNNKYLKNKLNPNDELPLYSILYLLYYIQILRSNEKELVLYMCYFLIDKFKNAIYAIFLCSKVKLTKHIHLYYKYLLTEDIKEQVLYDLKKKLNKDSIKHIEVGNIILYYLYKELFNIKIYDAITNQIDYFDILKNNFSSNDDKMTENFLSIGNTILKIRKEIMIIWDKIIKINPFCDEIYRDYSLYLEAIVKDDILYKEESKKYLLLKNEKFEEKDNMYHSMFLADKSTIILIDGCLSNGKILYTSPNFSMLFSYNVNELLNNTIDELLPNVIQKIHRELVINAIKYSNIKKIYKRLINTLLKNKNGRLFNIKLYVKHIPNLRYGLIYYCFLQKNNDSNFIIVLDKDLKVNGIADMTKTESSYGIGGKYNLNSLIYGYHIGYLIPDIFSNLYYKDGEFNIIKKNVELKGYLYPINKIGDKKSIVDNIIEKIKNNNINDNQNQIEDIIENIYDDYMQLINQFSKDNILPYNIFYKIQMLSFLEGKYKYYRIYITDDIIATNEKENLLQQKNLIDENKVSKKNNSKFIFRNTSISNKKIKEFKKKKSKKIKFQTISNDNKDHDFYKSSDDIKKKNNKR
jgi:PAS domain S-box-containing protein